MTTLTQLIEQYCPDGVEYVKLGDVATYYRGLTYSKKNEVESGGLKVLRANNVSLDTRQIDWNDVKTVELDKPAKSTCLLKQDDILMVANSGSKAHVGKITYINQDFVDVAFGGFMAAIRAEDKRLSRYIFHLLCSDEFNAYKDSVLSSATINNLKKSIVEDFQIPLPPREVQDAIVERLDAFAALIESLDSEITLREKRFAFFREQLLSFDESEGVEYVKLGDVADSVKSGATPKARTAEYYENGSIPWLRTNEVKFNIITSTEMMVTEKALAETPIKWIEAPSVVVAISGATAGRSAIIATPVTTNQHCCCLHFDETKADHRFVFNSLALRYEELKSLGRGARGDLNAGIIKNFQIPLPTLELQQDIADRLDTMQALIDNLKQERELRKTQFEYYREKLLTFNS